MKYTFEIACDNAAFESRYGPGKEVARILRVAAACIEHVNDNTKYTLRDVNGNKVGHHGFEGIAA
jgi:hypothetical protein